MAAPRSSCTKIIDALQQTLTTVTVPYVGALATPSPQGLFVNDVTPYRQTGLHLFVPLFAIGRGFFSMGEGLAYFNDDGQEAQFYSKRERRVRGTVKIITGLLLVDGGFEAYCSDKPLSTYFVADPLAFRFALHAFSEFCFALHDLYKLYNEKKAYRNSVTWVTDRNAAFLQATTKLLETIGWTMLTIGGLTNPVGFYFLAGAALCHIYRNVKRAASATMPCLFRPAPRRATNIGHDDYLVDHTTLRRRLPVY